jgi:hypothetical protein
MSVCRHTVKSQAALTYRKPGATSRSQAAARAHEFGLPDGDGPPCPRRMPEARGREQAAVGVSGAALAGSVLVVAADPAHRLPSRRLAGPRAGRYHRDRALLRLPGRELHPLVVVDDVQRPAVLQQVAG